MNLVACFIFCLANALAYEVITDGTQEYLLVPLHHASRAKRQTTNFSYDGSRATVGHTQPLFNNEQHSLRGSAFASRQFNPRGPLTTGTSVDYLHKPSGGTFSVSQQNTRGFGTDVSLSGKGTLFENKNHILQGSAQATKHFNPNGPWSAASSLDYGHKPSHSTLNVGVQHTERLGTDLGATGRWNFVDKKNTQIFTEGHYNRHFGGPGGLGKPDYGVGVGVKHVF